MAEQVAPSFSRMEIAGLLGVTPRTVSNWLAQGLPHVEAGRRGGGAEVRITVKDLLAWHVSREREQAGVIDQRSATDTVRRRKIAAEAELAELDLLKQLGQVVAIELVADAVGEQLGRVRTRLLALPARAAPLVAPEMEARACQETLRRLVDEALHELVGWAAQPSGGAEADGRAQGEDRPAAKAGTEADREPVGRRRKVPQPRGRRRARKVADRKE